MWLKDGNNCEKCPCAWEEWGPEDCDGGCYAGRDLFEGTCRLPYLVRWYIARRANFCKDHQYDGIGEWYEEQERKQRIVEEAIYKRDQNLTLCWEYKTEAGKTEYRPFDQKMVIQEICYDIVGAMDDYRRGQEPRTLYNKWSALVRETFKRAVFKIRYLLTI